MLRKETISKREVKKARKKLIDLTPSEKTYSTPVTKTTSKCVKSVRSHGEKNNRK